MSINRGMDKEDVVHIYNGILLSHKKDKILPIVTTWMDLEGFMLSEVSQMGKDKYCMISLVCRILKTNKQTKHKINEHTEATKNKHVDTENGIVVARGERGSVEE